jgi:hypothetical protein
MEASSSKE